MWWIEIAWEIHLVCVFARNGRWERAIDKKIEWGREQILTRKRIADSHDEEKKEVKKQSEIGGQRPRAGWEEAQRSEVW